MRELLKKIIRAWPWPLTLNEGYDRQTKAIIRQVCSPSSNCIDVGCFQGDILECMIQSAPEGRHIAFEPIPVQFQLLQKKFGHSATIYPYALGNANGTTTFNYVLTNPTYSGLQQRKYVREEQIEKINVEVRRLDEVIPPSLPIRLIKIDVEGGELDVLKGANQVLKNSHPVIIFEHGVGGADRYGYTPQDIYDLLTRQHEYRIMLMSQYLKNKNHPGFSEAALVEQFTTEANCYFVAV